LMEFLRSGGSTEVITDSGFAEGTQTVIDSIYKKLHLPLRGTSVSGLSEQKHEDATTNGSTESTGEEGGKDGSTPSETKPANVEASLSSKLKLRKCF